MVSSCTEPIITYSPTPNISPAIQVQPSSSNAEQSPSPIVYIPKKDKGAITGILNLGTAPDVNASIIIHTYDSITLKDIKFSEVKKNHAFIIDDISILDKHGTDVKLIISYSNFYKYINTKILDSKLTDIGTITFTEKDRNFFWGESMGARFIAIDQNGNILRDGIITDITGGFVSSSRKIREDGEFFISVSTAPIDSMFFRYIEIKSGSKIMTFSHKEGDTSGIHKITFVPNARTIFGHIFDSTNKSKPLQELKVKVLNHDIAVRTDEYGRFNLRGVPFDEVTIEIDDTLKVTVPKVSASEERILDNIYYSG